MKATCMAAALLLLTAALGGCGRDDAQARELSRLRTEVAMLKLQAQASKDWTAIANLQSMYGHYVDRMRWDDAADLFAANGRIAIEGREVLEGQERIRAWLLGLGKQQRELAAASHLPLQPVIHVGPDGHKAQARWRAIMPVMQGGGAARWTVASFENEYVKENGIWKISRLEGFADTAAPYHYPNPVSGREP